MDHIMPTAFVSHGSPMLVVQEGAAHQFLKGFADKIPAPKAILMVSAHWEAAKPTVSMAKNPETIHDFGGFPRELYSIQYPAPGAPDLAEHTAGLLEAAGFEVDRSTDRGIDHGAWVPLKLVYPQANIPVTQLSIQTNQGAAYHYKIGQALQALRNEGVLILGSGAVTHNLEAFFKGSFDHDADVPDWVHGFSDWLATAMQEGRIEDLLAYRDVGPFAVENHPTEDHLLPLFVALGAASGTPTAERAHASNTYGILAMDAYMMN